MPFGEHTLLLSLEGGLLAFGENINGELGLGHRNIQWQPAEVPWNGPQPVQVDWGRFHSLALDAEGGVWQAGGCRTIPSSSTFQQVPELPPISSIAAGDSLRAALDTEGSLWVWTDWVSVSRASSLPQRVKGLPPLLKVACGYKFLVAEAEEGLWLLGNKESGGQLGYFDTASDLQSNPVQVEERSEGPLRYLTADFDGVVLIDWEGGVFSSVQQGRSYANLLKYQRIKNIPPMLTSSCGTEHTLCLDENGGVWSWGKNGSFGRFGRGDDTDHEPALVPSLKGISAVVAAYSHSLVFPQEGGLLVFGNNSKGQLGLSRWAQLLQSVCRNSCITTPTLCPVQPALPHSFSFTRSRKKSARSAPL